MTELNRIIQHAQAGDLTAFGDLVCRFQDVAVGYAYGILGDMYLAEDAAQEAFLEAYRCLPALREPNAFASWLRRIVFKQCDRLTRRKRLPTVALENVEYIADDLADAWRAVEQAEVRRQVNGHIQSLPDAERIVVSLFYISGYSQKEIATLLEESSAQVNSRLQRARKRLKERMMNMVENSLQENRPSKDEVFTTKVMKMIQAARHGDAHQVAVLADEDPKLVSATGAMPYAVAKIMQPLHMAIVNGNHNVVQTLIEKGADVNAKDDRGRSPLHIALQNGGQTPIAETLIENGAKIDIFVAVWLNDNELVNSILAKDPALAKAIGPDGTSTLHYSQEVDLAKQLLERGADPNLQDNQQQPPLVWHGWNVAMVDLLRANGAIVDDIYTASAIGDIETVRTQITANAQVIHSTKPGWANVLVHGQETTPLVPAMYYQHEDVVRLLLEHGADPDLRFFGEGFTLLHEAVKVGHEPILRLLLEHGANPNIIDNVTDSTPWDWAFEHIRMKEILAEHGGKGAVELAK
ncbi:sigma-70 family RNA polymerase sigma factor [Chloroflexi bacterium TSY]|nr:sigma-70 family RNA polymerase sigma factor [Chloroflexi bacterium TSY]